MSHKIYRLGMCTAMMGSSSTRRGCGEHVMVVIIVVVFLLVHLSITRHEIFQFLPGRLFVFGRMAVIPIVFSSCCHGQSISIRYFHRVETGHGLRDRHLTYRFTIEGRIVPICCCVVGSRRKIIHRIIIISAGAAGGAVAGLVDFGGTQRFDQFGEFLGDTTCRGRGV